MINGYHEPAAKWDTSLRVVYSHFCESDETQRVSLWYNGSLDDNNKSLDDNKQVEVCCS